MVDTGASDEHFDIVCHSLGQNVLAHLRRGADRVLEATQQVILAPELCDGTCS